ncbi:hypothetical protein EGI26_16855 [Lacihabitans sp. CCS-44]|uniref:tail fiber domain-containing protein n=1 Tax=Lacihabitans sp. CCS-44 TaxID=2487331 RepID=UPI0020CD7FE1|nr:tail fiber domain-containing protein [Lacihabitans sp. CCS-44]MCP9756837.1 hypothetical protein [Lacihabitans sp. CCS-44]
MKLKLLLLAFVLITMRGFSQSILLEPTGTGQGIFSKRSSFYNSSVSTPLVLPDSGVGTRLMWIPERSAFRAGSVSGTQWNNANIGPYSFALGLDLKVTGLAAGAVGFQNQASGLQSFAGGFSNIAAGNQSMAFGVGNNTSGAASLALGHTNLIPNTGTNSVVIGQGNSVQVSNNYLIGKDNLGKNILEFAFGYENDVSAARSFSVGYFNKNSGVSSYNFGEANTTHTERAMNLGFNNQSSGIRAVAIGSSNTPSGDFHLAIGTGNNGSGVQSLSMGTVSNSNSDMSISGGLGIVNNSYASVMLGIYNDSLLTDLASGGISKTVYDANDPLFIIGNGTANNARSNALTMYKNGRVGLGTNLPSQLLDVNGSARFRSVTTDNANTVFLSIETDGTLKKTTPTASDMRLKQNIVALENPLEKIMQMRGVSYEFKETPDQKRMGFIAQEVEKVYPEAVFEIEQGGLKGVRYDDLIPVLLEALKTQQRQIEALQKQMTEITGKAQP